MSGKGGKLPPMPSRSTSVRSSHHDGETPVQASRPGSNYSLDMSNGAYKGAGGEAGGEAGDFAASFAKNPFQMPADEEVFKMREEEKMRKMDERERLKGLRVEEKTTFSSRMSNTYGDALKEVDDRKGEGSRDLAATAALPTDHRRRDKENMIDFIAKKREIFLVQMSLDTKRAEIRKLEERALQREEALCKSEQMLEEDALRFDAFLKENDQKVQEAIKRAELEAKAKQDKVHEIKRLNAAITTIRSELNKYEEQLEDCRKYKHFLDAVTPPEFFKDQEDKRQARRAARRAKRQAKRDAYAQLVQTAKDLELDIPVKESMLAEASRRGRTAEEAAAKELEAAKQAAQDAYARIPEQPPPPEPENDDSDEEMPMFFERPTQLLDMFAQLEEQNLFLIQNSQETEEALEELKNKYRSTTHLMEDETGSLEAQIAELKTAIAREEKKGGELKEKTNEQTDGLLTGQESSLDDLSAKVSEVYNKCGFDYDPSISTIQMLTNIEAKLEEYLDVIDTLPPDFVEAAEKQKEKERRARFREEKIEQQRREQEARVQRSLERAQAPVHKKVGKTLMFRSQPPSRKKKEEVVSINTEEEELQAFLATDF